MFDKTNLVRIALTMLATAAVVTIIHLVLHWLIGPMPADKVFLHPAPIRWADRVTYSLPLILHGGFDRFWFDLLGYPVLVALWMATFTFAKSTVIINGRVIRMSLFGVSIGLVMGLFFGVIFAVGCWPIFAGLIKRDSGPTVLLYIGLVALVVAIAVAIHATAALLFLALLASLLMFFWGLGYGLYALWEIVKDVRITRTA